MGTQRTLGAKNVRAGNAAAGAVDVGRVVWARQAGAKVWNGLLDVHAATGAGNDEMAFCVGVREERGVEFGGVFREWRDVEAATVGLDVQGVELREAAGDAAAGCLDVEPGGKEGC